jgi:hypothetical protein
MWQGRRDKGTNRRESPSKTHGGQGMPEHWGKKELQNDNSHRDEHSSLMRVLKKININR